MLGFVIIKRISWNVWIFKSKRLLSWRFCSIRCIRSIFSPVQPEVTKSAGWDLSFTLAFINAIFALCICFVLIVSFYYLLYVHCFMFNRNVQRASFTKIASKTSTPNFSPTEVCFECYFLSFCSKQPFCRFGPFPVFFFFDNYRNSIFFCYLLYLIWVWMNSKILHIFHISYRFKHICALCV